MSLFNQGGEVRGAGISGRALLQMREQANSAFSQDLYNAGLQGHRGLGQQWQGQQGQIEQQYYEALLRSLQSTRHMPYAGNRYIVICNGAVTELPADASVEAAEEKAAELATSTQCPAFVLKPIKKVAPKRETVTTDLT